MKTLLTLLINSAEFGWQVIAMTLCHWIITLFDRYRYTFFQLSCTCEQLHIYKTKNQIKEIFTISEGGGKVAIIAAH